MVLFLGLTSLGAANLLTHRAPRGIAYCATGLLGIGLVRPHVGLLAVASLAMAVVLRSSAGSRGRQAARLLTAMVAIVGGALLADATAERFQVDRLGTEQVADTLTYTAEKTNTGGATFAAARVDSPLDYPMAVVTVLFRPFPGEARTAEGFASSAEALALAAVLVGSVARIRTALRSLRRRPYLLYAAGFVLSFCYAFAVIGNFGILARQRSQVLPLLFVFVAMPAHHAIRRRAGSSDRRRRWRGAGTAAAPRHVAAGLAADPAPVAPVPVVPGAPTARRRPPPSPPRPR